MKRLLEKILGNNKAEPPAALSSSACLILRSRDPEYTHSPEFQFLESYLNRQIEKVFGSGITFDAGPLSSSNSGSFDYVLYFENVRTLITAESLARMKERIDAGAKVVSPTRLDSVVGAVDAPPPSTLRMFEELEIELLSARERWLQPAPGMVSLISAECFKELVAGEDPVDFGSGLERLNCLFVRPELVLEGLCFQFSDYYGQAREDILPFVPEKAKDVLEIGCARGLTGKFLQEQLGCRVTGVEQNPEIAEQARKHLHDIIVGDIESVAITEKFDVVVATELFEHLLEPIRFLQSMKSVLRPGGRIVLTVPNVGHWSIVEDLLQGRWDYLPMGILCYTHFRFFTSRTIEDWLQRAGFTNFEIIRQSTEVPERFTVLSQYLKIDRESLSTSGFYVVIDV